MTNKTPQDLIKKINEAIHTKNPSVIKDFLEEFAFEIVEAQRPEYEKLLIGAAEQGIISERERCVNLLEKHCKDNDLKAQLVNLVRNGIDESQVQS